MRVAGRCWGPEAVLEGCLRTSAHSSSRTVVMTGIAMQGFLYHWLFPPYHSGAGDLCVALPEQRARGLKVCLPEVKAAPAVSGVFCTGGYCPPAGAAFA